MPSISDIPRSVHVLDQGRYSPLEEPFHTFRRLADAVPHVVWITDLNPERVIYVSPSFEEIWGRSAQALYDDPRLWVHCIHPEDRKQVEERFQEWISGHARTCQGIEYRVLQPSGAVRWVTDHGVVTFDQAGKPIRISGMSTDITELKVAAQEHRSHLWFLESLDKVNQAIQGTNDLEQMMGDVLHAVLAIFDCDRAWLVFPCEPDTPAWRVLLEQTRPGYAVAPDTDHATCEGAAEVFRAARESPDVARYGVGAHAAVPEDLARSFGVRGLLCVALQPKAGTRYVFGLHQCRAGEPWSAQSEQLFREIGRRLADAIGTLWTFRGLRESEARLEAAQRQARLGYWNWDVETDILTWSDETYRIFGLLPHERALLLADANQMIHPSDRARVAAATAEALAGSGNYLVEYRAISRGLGLRYVHSEGQVVRDANGKPISIFGTLQDITTRKRAENLFAAQHAVTRLLAEAPSVQDAIPQILAAIGESLVWEVANLWRFDATTQRFRCTEIWLAPSLEAASWEAAGLRGSLDTAHAFPAEVRATREPCFIPDIVADARFEPVSRTAAHGLHAAFAYPILLAADVWGVMAFFSPEARDPDRDLLATMATLGSQIGQFIERKQAETALLHAREQLAHVTRVTSLGEMTASIAHEVNQPLTGIIANASAALRWLALSPPDLGEAIAAIQRLARDGKRAGEVVERVRTLVRKGEERRKANVDVAQIIKETLPLIRSEIQQKEVAIQLELAPALAPIFADRVQVQQVLLNLLMNALEALDAVHDRPRELTVRATTRDSRALELSVIDNGVGLPPDHMARIFDAFFTTKPQGMGMGLAISRAIVEEHGGQLSAASSADGTCFQFWLPTAAASDARSA